MWHATLVDASDLAAWANRIDAQNRLPQVVRKLVHASTTDVLRAGFPAGEGVQLGGWDGVVVVPSGNAFVPSGVSAWELGTDKAVKGKADSDYEKRKADLQKVGGTTSDLINPAESTFVFVTPRRWGNKGTWAATRQAEGFWREVRAYDADDLEEWLDLAPAVHVWLSILTGKQPQGVTDLETFWSDWSEATRPTMTAGMVLAGRDEAAERVRGWMRNSAATLAVRADSREEALVAVAATLSQMPREEHDRFLSRFAVVHDPSAWSYLATAGERLLLAATFEVGELVARATRNGHRVVIPLGRADSAFSGTLELPRLSRAKVAAALAAVGLPEERARDLSLLARRSLTAFRRKLAAAPEVQQPAWARPIEVRNLLPALLAGGWDDSAEGDRDVVAALAQGSYDEVRSVCVRWSNEPDPPLRRVGNAWFLVSPEDTWSLLARYLTRDDLERLEQIAADVFGTADPRFDLPESRRFMARITGHLPRHSGLLRKGLADTLAAMGTLGDSWAPSAGLSPTVVARRTVRRLLARANEDWRIWASLAPSLPRFAEAAPDEALEAMEQGLEGEDSPLLKLFMDRDVSLFGDSQHSWLLWALETLSWSPEHFGRAALLLARLARVEPGGKLANRPAHSLHNIFLPWLPQTTAPLEQRLRVLDVIRQREPAVAWKLLRGLLPTSHEIGHFAATPHWRNWSPDQQQRVTVAEYLAAVGEIVTRLLDDAGQNGERWRELVERLATLPPDQHEAVVGRLDGLDVGGLSTQDRASIWHALRKLISHHRSYSEADWALPKERVDRLEAIFHQFEPEEPGPRFGWLFGHYPELPEGRETDWQVRHTMVEGLRFAAVRAVYESAGLSGLLELAEFVELPAELGATAGQGGLLEEVEDDLIRERLAEANSAGALFTRGVVIGRVATSGREWVEAKLAGPASAWPAAQRAYLLVCLPFDGRTWNTAEESGLETEREYWRVVRAYTGDASAARWVAQKLLEHGRPYSAVDVMATPREDAAKEDAEPLPSELIAEALEATLRTLSSEDPVQGDFAHDVAVLLNALEAAEGFDENRLASLEWAFLPIIAHAERSPRLLHRELARDPNLFVEVVSYVYRAKGEERGEVSADADVRARHGYELLRTWRRVPGRTDDGVDAEALKEWVRRTRELLVEAGRIEIGEQIIGQALSGSPDGTDGAWPHPAVRDVIETLASSSLERGFEVAIYNRRGIITKSIGEGGAQERELSDRYAGFAAAIADVSPRTAAMLRRIADGYRSEARSEDLRAEFEEDVDS